MKLRTAIALILIMAALLLMGGFVAKQLGEHTPPACLEQWKFDPKPDITAYELADIFTHANDLRGSICATKPMQGPFMRHFRRIA